jgi:hypothetical protein
MLTIIYPENDYTSADIAIRVQALAQGQGQKIYVVPKHLGRNEENIFKNLKKTDTVLFIAYDKTQLDNSTLDELSWLIKNNKLIHAIVPDNMKMDLGQNLRTYTYSQMNHSDFAAGINRFVNQLQNEQKVKNGTKNDNILVLVGLLVLSILFLSLVNDGKK